MNSSDPLSTPQVQAIILAAGQGTRMKSALPKVLHPVGGQPMVAHVLAAAELAGVTAAQLVCGHGADAVQAWAQSSRFAGSTGFALQAQQLGTGHAVQQAMPAVPDTATVVVLYGDVPLVTADVLQKLIAGAQQGLALVSVRVPVPRGYGRILRDAQGGVRDIVEEADATPEQRAIDEINTGLLAAPAGLLRGWLRRLRNDNAKGEYYLTDVVAMAVAEGIAVQAVMADDGADFEGVNDRMQLARAERRYQQRAAEQLMRQGVSFADPARFDLRGQLSCGRDVFIDVGVIIEGCVTLGDGARVGAYSCLRDVHLEAGAEVLSHSVLEGATLASGARVGPFSRLRPGARLEADVHVGNFVEVKNSRLGAGTKAGHLAYLGDADVGRDVNISAGVITCNYDGANKHQTVIGDGAFIGTDSQLVAPVTIGPGAFIAAGSTITRDAPADALTLCRAREQHSSTGWRRPVKKGGKPS